MVRSRLALVLLLLLPAGGCDEDADSPPSEARLESDLPRPPECDDCPTRLYCSAETGCIEEWPCTFDADCRDAWPQDPCRWSYACDLGTGLCQAEWLDEDGDGHVPERCGGDDCDDQDRQVRPRGARPCGAEDCDVESELACREPGQVCTRGRCACPAENLCDGECTGLDFDPNNCGACGNVCPVDARCEAGVCTPNEYAPGGYCATWTKLLHDCGLLTEGRYNCREGGDAAEACETRCLKDASCAGVWGHVCDYYNRDDLGTCMRDCLGVNTFGCKDDSYGPARGTRCDGRRDCVDSSDEHNCRSVSGVCRNVDERYPKKKRCDGVFDCSDQSDEYLCPELLMRCQAYGQDLAIHTDLYCNGVTDCTSDGFRMWDEPPGCATLICRDPSTR